MPALSATMTAIPWFLADAAGRPRVREIDTHLSLTRVTRRSEDLQRIVAAQLSLQAEAAAEMHFTHAEFRRLLLDVRIVADDLSGLSCAPPLELRSLRESIAVQLLSVANGLAQRSRIFERVSKDGLSQNAPSTLHEAAKHLEAGLDHTGAERDESFANALALFQAAADTPCGAIDSAVWLQIGWLHWNLKDDLLRAEEALTIASGLSSQSSIQHRVDTLRHLAHIRYLRTDMVKAHETACEATALSDDLDALFDRARYASRIGLDDEAEGLLLTCIQKRPTTFIAMLSEEDFCSDR